MEHASFVTCGPDACFGLISREVGMEVGWGRRSTVLLSVHGDRERELFVECLGMVVSQEGMSLKTYLHHPTPDLQNNSL